MPKRDDWTFQYATSELLTAVEAKVAFHTDRADYWRQEASDAENDLLTSGISVREAVDVHSNVTRFHGDVSVDQDKLKRFKEAEGKMKDHEDKLAEFSRWITAFKKPGDHVLELTISDINYFGL